MSQTDDAHTGSCPHAAANKELRASKLDALVIILTSPLWPARDELPANALPLYDRITEDAKAYALHLAAHDYAEAFLIAARWTAPLNALLDNVRVSESEPARRMLAVYRHYMDAARVDWTKCNA